MPDKVFLATLLADALFLASGAMELGFSIAAMNLKDKAPTDGKDATRHLVYQRFPLTAGIANAIFVLATFVFTIPALALAKRNLLKIGGYMITVCGAFTLAVGLYLWIMTLRLKETFEPVYAEQDSAIQSLVQTSFQCCGYLNSTSPAFVTDTACPSPAAAALLRGCSTNMASFANAFINDLFTAVFGMVGIDALLILAIACLLKERKEIERYYIIDQKRNYGGL
ncbi:tetraspanin [Trichoderma cornu-damae]|uniref:Tetraspanin n=1 Tax=Trichoderma cornu-damae TaxID=654480 RepID=A0A9P8TVU4_9HYPO|nr:tetraspanin [Trichoderma cornu-damae]